MPTINETINLQNKIITQHLKAISSSINPATIIIAQQQEMISKTITPMLDQINSINAQLAKNISPQISAITSQISQSLIKLQSIDIENIKSEDIDLYFSSLEEPLTLLETEVDKSNAAHVTKADLKETISELKQYIDESVQSPKLTPQNKIEKILSYIVILITILEFLGVGPIDNNHTHFSVEQYNLNININYDSID